MFLPAPAKAGLTLRFRRRRQLAGSSSTTSSMMVARSAAHCSGGHRSVADDVPAHHVLDILNIAPAFGITVLQPNKCSSDVGRTMLDVVHNDRLLGAGWHENFHSVIVIAVGALVQRALNALVRCVLSNPYGFRKFRGNYSSTI